MAKGRPKTVASKKLMNPLIGAPPPMKKGKRQTAAGKKAKGY